MNLKRCGRKWSWLSECTVPPLAWNDWGKLQHIFGQPAPRSEHSESDDVTNYTVTPVSHVGLSTLFRRSESQ
jgi:hypothetical protein